MKYILRVTIDDLKTNKREVDYRETVNDREDIDAELRNLGSLIESGDFPFKSEITDEDEAD